MGKLRLPKLGHEFKNVAGDDGTTVQDLTIISAFLSGISICPSPPLPGGSAPSVVACASAGDRSRPLDKLLSVGSRQSPLSDAKLAGESTDLNGNNVMTILVRFVSMLFDWFDRDAGDQVTRSQS